MKREDAIAQVLLKELDTKESHKRRINESAYEYYTGRNLIGFIAALCFVTVCGYLLIRNILPLWGFFALTLATAARMESTRNSRRIDAMVKFINSQEKAVTKHST